MHEVLVNRLGGLSLPKKSVVRLTDRPDMTLDVYRGRKTTMQCNMQILEINNNFLSANLQTTPVLCLMQNSNSSLYRIVQVHLSSKLVYVSTFATEMHYV